MKSKTTLFLSLFALAAAGLSHAEEPADGAAKEGSKEGSKKVRNERGHHPRLLEADLDGDGVITAEEFQKFHQALFQKADTDGDGKLSREEVLALSRQRGDRAGWIPPAPGPEHRSGRRGAPDAPPRDPEQILSMFDANDDGKLSRDEVPGPLAARFDDLDLDGDGYLTIEEFQKAREQIRENFRTRRSGDGERSERGDFLGGMIQRFDTNQDGKLQKEELPERFQEFFGTLDINQDGALDAEELKGLREHMGQFWRDGSRERQRRPRGTPAPATDTPTETEQVQPEVSE
jgi:Ca2+-binding EF-hand superfamily protein